jgi:hypothetical protein
MKFGDLFKGGQDERRPDRHEADAGRDVRAGLPVEGEQGPSAGAVFAEGVAKAVAKGTVVRGYGPRRVGSPVSSGKRPGPCACDGRRRG